MMPPMRRLPALVFWSAIAAWLLGQWLCIAGLPLLSEDWTHREFVAGFASFADCFDRSKPPPRPLQHAFFWLAIASDASPAAMRLVLFLLHLGSVAAVAALARAAGLSVSRARLAALVFALYPAVRSLGWPAAISGPGHVCFELLGLLAFACGRPGGWGTAAAVAVLQLVAVAFHPSAVLLPLLLLGWRAWVLPAAATPWRGARRALREPALLGALLLAVLALCWILPAPGPHGGVRELGAMLANGARAAVFWLPEPLRVAIIEGLRGGGAGLLLGLLALLGIAAAAAWWCWRGGGLPRFAVVAIALDLGLAIAKAGWSLRYALLPAALLALAAAAARGRWLRVGVPLLALSFALDSLRDVADFAAAGRGAERLLAAAVAARARLGGGPPLWIVDPPAEHGAERDIPVWNWGLRQALAARGVRDVRPVSSRHAATAGSDLEARDAAAVQQLLQDRSAAVLWCRDDGAVEFLPPGR